MNLDLEKSRRENLRWVMLLALNSARPLGTNEAIILSAVQPVVPDVTNHELRRELGYLKDRQLIEISIDNNIWFCKLTRDGIDVVEYTASCDAGISRPAKYW